MAANKPLTLDIISAQLDEWLEIEFSFLHTEKPAAIIADLERPQQDFILTWVKRISSTNIQLAFQFISQVVETLARMDKPVIEAWALHAMDVYDQSGLYTALKVITDVDHFIQLSHERTAGAVLEEETGILSHFAHGLSGRKLKLESSEELYTDSETIFLPAIVAKLENTKDNFKLYKSMVAYHWAQTRFGSFRIRLSEILAQQKEQGKDPHKFLALFNNIECLRLEACIQKELPGLYRDMQLLNNDVLQNNTWLSIADTVSKQNCKVKDVLDLTNKYFETLEPVPLRLYQGSLQPEKVEACMDLRIEKEKAQLRTILRNIIDEIKNKQAKQNGSEEQNISEKFKKLNKENSDITLPENIELTLDGQPMPLPEEAKVLMNSIIQDIGDIPEEYLEAAGDGEYDAKFLQDEEAAPEDVWKGTYHEDGAFLYNEWDFRRQHYRKNWCAVREIEIKPVYDDFVEKTLNKHGGYIKQLRKTFEAMRDENRLLKRQTNGDGIDIDALVEALADARDGSEMSDRLFTHMHKVERNIAVVFMVDMSGSTKGWINQAERESLLLLAETLETLGDRYAIYGFSGMARKRCEIYRIKEIDEPYNDEVKARISGIQPKDYTRMGFAIRHLSHILNEIEAKTRILITISDGKPDDYDNYRGEYGIEDTRRALIEARRDGIHSYCITIDKEARDYLPHMYGAAAYTVIDEIQQLPLKVSDIYRRLTT